MTDIFLINGSGGVGKDEFVKQCRKALKDIAIEKYNGLPESLHQDYDVINYSSIEKIKTVATILTGWTDNDKKTEKMRKFLCDLTQVWDSINGRKKHIEGIIGNFIHKGENMEHLFAFIHIREPGMIDDLKKKYGEYGVHTLLVTNKNAKPIVSNDADMNTNFYEYDYYIRNDGTIEDLYDSAVQFVKQFIGVE